MTTTVDRLITVARAQIGYREGYSGGHWNNNEKYAAEVPGLAWANWQPWCDVFVAWCFLKADCLNLLPGGPTASVAQSLANWKRAGRFSEYPAIGAQVIYGNGAHTGIVVGYDANTITTVEGNTNTDGSAEGNGVYLKTRQRRDPWVTGYGYPKFPEGIKSADPAYAKEAPVTPTSPSRWARVRHQLLVVLNSPDAKNIARSRVAVRAFLATTRAAIKRLPTS